MAITKNCPTCGKEFTGNINKLFCGDTCRKYFSRHRKGYSGMVLQTSIVPQLTDKSGQSRTSARSGTGDYFMKRLMDVAAKVATSNLVGASNNPQTGGKQPLTDLQPLETVAPMVRNSPNKEPQRFKPQLSSPFQELLGDLKFPFQMLLWGLPGSGKSTLALQLANQLAHFRRVLYVSGEEGVRSATLADKQQRTLTQPHVQFSFIPRLPATTEEWKGLLYEAPMLDGFQLQPYGTVVYDSITMLNIHPFYVKATSNDLKLPDFSVHLGHIFISHAHKDGKEYRGDGSWGHEVDIIIRCHEGTATVQKNRFATANKGRIGSEYMIYN